MMAIETRRTSEGPLMTTQAARSDLRLAGFPIASVDTTEPATACGHLGRLRLRQSILLRLEGAGLVRAAAVTVEVSGGIVAVDRLSLYDYTVTAVAPGEGVPCGRVVFLDGSVAYVPFTAHVPFAEPRADGLRGFATVGVIRVEAE